MQEEAPKRARHVEVPADAAGWRLDRFLARWFRDRSRTALARGIRSGLVTDLVGRPLRASSTLRGNETLCVYLPGIAPGTAPPPLPPLLFEDDRVAVLDKPAGLLAHPAGTEFAWSIIGLAKERWPDARIDLVHRLDRDTSGVLVITKDLDANRFLKAVFHDGGAIKEYEAICKGEAPWESRVCEGPIAPANGPIRVQMAVRDDGQSARTDVTVLARRPDLTWVHCRLWTGRTHQIRVHLAHEGLPLLGDRLYGVPLETAFTYLEEGLDADVIEAASGAPRQALHAARLRFPHPDGFDVDVRAPVPEEMRDWWATPAARTP